MAAALKEAAQAADVERWDAVLAALPGDLAGRSAYGQWLRAEALRQTKSTDAAAAYAAVPTGSRWEAPSRRRQADIAAEEGRWSDVLAHLDAITGPASADSLLVRAQAQRELVPELAEATLRQARAKATGTTAAAAETLLSAWGLTLGPGDDVLRADALSARLDYDAVIELLGPRREALLAESGQAEGAFQLGRAFHKRRRYTDSLDLLRFAASDASAADRMVRAKYLYAQALARTSQVPESVAAFVALAEAHPEHSFADDALLHAAGLELGEGRLDAGRALLERARRDFPLGDMAPDVRWTLLWSHLRPWVVPGPDGAALPPAATTVDPLLAEFTAGSEPGSREHQVRARYWDARLAEGWGLDDAPERWQRLAAAHPLHWYGALAAARLGNIDAARLRALRQEVGSGLTSVRAVDRRAATFLVEPTFLALPATQQALFLLRAGLSSQAAEELRFAVGERPDATWNEHTLLFAAHLARVIDAPALAMDWARRAVTRWDGTLDATHATLLFHAWPLAFHDDVRTAVAGRGWDAFLLQALVREESSFAPGIVSWAGAVGLSQLMPETARLTARKHGIKASLPRALCDPGTNLRIGAAYLDDLLGTWTGREPLAVASYNAGPGAVRRWIENSPSAEIDAFVEAIPYDQTRHYVVRVVGSWQAYHALYAESPGYVPIDLRPVGGPVTQ